MRTKIRDLSHDGRGIGTIEGKTIFVENAYPGEEIEVKITKEKKNYLEGELLEIIKKSPDRIEAICQDFYHCNGCQYCDYNYKAQLESKQERVKANFKKIAGLDLEEIKISGMENFYNYRNHIQLKIENGKIGYVDKKNFSVFKPKNCIVAPKNTGKIIEILEGWKAINKFSLLGIRENYKEQLMLIFVMPSSTNKKEKVDFSKIIDSLAKYNVSHIFINYNNNPKFHYGKNSKKIFGQGEFQEKILDNKFNLSPTSFFQVNRKQAELLYKKAIENLDLNKEDKVLELYSGIGTISMELAKGAKEVTGIEYASSAVEDAKENAKINKMTNTKFISGKVEEKLAAFKGDYNKILLDPPRAGADKKVIDAIIKLEAEKISYISCDPATLARDIKLLLESGKYKLEKVEIVDMFPLSSHVETVVLMSRN